MESVRQDAHVDPGMTQAQAEALAVLVRSETAHVVVVEPDDIIEPDDDQWFRVTVRRSSGDTWTLYDEQDWDWLRGRILGNE